MRRKLLTIFTFSLIILIWYFASLEVNQIFVPSPVKVFEDAKELLASGKLQINAFWTFKRIFTASVISGVISLPLGLMIYNFTIFKDTIYPVISLMRYVPVAAFYPLLIMWLGIGEEMKIAFLFVSTFVYMMPSVLLALDEINQDLIDTGLTIGMSKLQVITKIQLPATLPSIMNSFIMCFGIGFTYCSVCETINAKYGIGYMIQQSSSRGKTDLVFLGIISIMVISFVFDNLSKLLIRKIFKWRYIND